MGTGAGASSQRGQTDPWAGRLLHWVPCGCRNTATKYDAGPEGSRVGRTDGGNTKQARGPSTVSGDTTASHKGSYVGTCTDCTVNACAADDIKQLQAPAPLRLSQRIYSSGLDGTCKATKPVASAPVREPPTTRTARGSCSCSSSSSSGSGVGVERVLVGPTVAVAPPTAALPVGWGGADGGDDTRTPLNIRTSEVHVCTNVATSTGIEPSPTASTSSFSTSSSTISSPSTDSSPGATVKTLPESDLLAEYVVERVLGRGSNGKVRLCRSTGSQELHALKAVRGSAAGSNQKRNRLNRKLSDAGRSSLHPPAPALGETISVSLQPHDNLLRVYEVILNDPLQPEGGAHVVMEAAIGGDLTAANFRGEGVLDEARLAATMLGAARGLGHLHALGVVHGDIKLGNLLLGGPHGRTVKVADLGCASRFDPSTTPPSDWWVTNRPAGTPAYLAPEQTTEQPYLGPPADVWALGVCLFQLASGRLPFQANSIIGLYAAIAGHEASPVEDLVGTVSPELEDLLRRMLTKAHSDRISVPDMLEHAWLRQPAE